MHLQFGWRAALSTQGQVRLPRAEHPPQSCHLSWASSPLATGCPKAVFQEDALLFSPFVLPMPSTEWIRPTHTKEGYLFYLAY